MNLQHVNVMHLVPLCTIINYHYSFRYNHVIQYEILMDGLGTRRLEVLKGHLVGQGDVKPLECSGVKSSAPMSSTKAEVQRAFPRHRYVRCALANRSWCMCMCVCVFFFCGNGMHRCTVTVTPCSHRTCQYVDTCTRTRVH